MNQRELQCVAPNAKFEGMDAASLERSVTTHIGMLTKFTNLANIIITTLKRTSSQRAAQELERLKQQIDWKVEDIEAGYDILLADLATDDAEYVRLNAIVVETVGRHATISKKMVEAIGAAPATQDTAATPARAGGDQVKLKKGLKPTILTLDFNPQEFQAWQNKFGIYYRMSRMSTANPEEQRGYFYSCISEHLQAVLTRNTPIGASIFREEGQQDESCFNELAQEFHQKYPLSTKRYELFMMRQPKGKTNVVLH